MQLPLLGRNAFNLGNVSEKSIGNLGNSSDCSTELFDLSSRKFPAPKISSFSMPVGTGKDQP